MLSCTTCCAVEASPVCNELHPAPCRSGKADETQSRQWKCGTCVCVWLMLSRCAILSACFPIVMAFAVLSGQALQLDYVVLRSSRSVSGVIGVVFIHNSVQHWDPFEHVVHRVQAQRIMHVLPRLSRMLNLCAPNQNHHLHRPIAVAAEGLRGPLRWLFVCGL